MTENDFNSEVLSKGLRRLSPEVHYYKASDKFTVGVSDYIIWGWGQSAVLESKFVAEWPGPNRELLKHEFKGAQTTFLESVALTKNRAWGCIGIGEEKKIYVFSHLQIPPGGNWKTSQFQYMQYKSFGFKDVDLLARWLFEEVQ